MLMEPVTSLTDVILTFLAGGLAWWLWRLAPRPVERRDLFWTTSFVALALATTLGAIIHGFPLGGAWYPVWAGIRFWTTVAEVCFFLGSLYSVLGDRLARRLTPGVLAAFGFLFVVLVVTHDAFMLFEAIGIGAATLLYAFHYVATSHPRALSLPGASVFFAAGAGLQAEQASFQLVWTFNGDDIFHLALMGALVCIAAAAHPSLPPLDTDGQPRRTLQTLAGRFPGAPWNFPRGPFGRR
jgi:hypothetical protein